MQCPSVLLRRDPNRHALPLLRYVIPEMDCGALAAYRALNGSDSHAVSGTRDDVHIGLCCRHLTNQRDGEKPA